MVTGGAGYIGSHAVRHLVEEGIEVVVADNLSAGHRAAVHPEADFVNVDLLDAGAVDAVFSNYAFDGVLHFAGRIVVSESVVKPKLYLEGNVRQAENVLNAMAAHRVSRLVFSSTAAVYDSGGAEPLGEHAPIGPNNPYGESKHLIEEMIFRFQESHGIKAAVLRYFNASGAHPDGDLGEAHDPETHLIPLVIGAALGRQKAVSLYGSDYPTADGTCVRDYVHVWDLAAAHRLALAKTKSENLICNLGTGKGISVREVLTIVREVTGAEFEIIEEPRRPGDAPHLVAAVETAREKLGWIPDWSELHTIVDTAWRWHKNHPNGYDG